MNTNFQTLRSFTIGELARQAGVPADTIRHYEREGLLPAPQRRASGYREYDADAIKRVRFIRRAKSLGFSLEQISELLSLSRDRAHGVEGIKRQASQRLAEVNARIAELVAIRDELTRLVNTCPGGGDPEGCPILSAILGDEPLPPPTNTTSCCGHGVQNTDAEAH